LICSSKQVLIMLWGTALAMTACAGALAAPPTEYEVKAAFIHNIAKFVEWPKTASTAGPLKLCILGRDPFGNALDVLRGKTVHDQPWEVLHVNSDHGLGGCGVLFIAASERNNLTQVLDATKGSAVLTVGDSEGYAERGVMVNFYLQDNMVRIEVNLDASRRAGLSISSQLLKLVRVVQEPGGVR
jgi:hypothetical protein